MDASPSPEPVYAEAIMDDVRRQVRADLQARLVAHGAAEEFSDPQVFDEVDGLLRRALLPEDRGRLLLPHLFDQEWAPRLAMRFSTHRRGPGGSLVLFAKRRLLLPLTRWLFEYSLENFRTQDRVNVALMACLQSLAADHVKLRQRLDALEQNLQRERKPPVFGEGPDHG